MQAVQQRRALLRCNQIAREKVQVTLRGADLGVPQHHRQPNDVTALPEVVGGERVAEPVPAETRQVQLLQQQVQRRSGVALLPSHPTEAGEHVVAGDPLLVAKLPDAIQGLAQLG
jgi:hypothetical protein